MRELLGTSPAESLFSAALATPQRSDPGPRPFSISQREEWLASIAGLN
jgi:hypothetical protein